jgi:hypothetical protein
VSEAEATGDGGLAIVVPRFATDLGLAIRRA